MQFQFTDEIGYPRDVVFATHRDRLAELIPYLPNVASVAVRERVEDGGVVRLVNDWAGSSDDVPRLLRGLVKPEMMTWTDRARWDGAAWRCDWETQINWLPDAVTAKGFNLFFDEGDRTVIKVTGDFIVHPDKIPGIPSIVARGAAPTIEKWVLGLLEPNLKRSNRAVEQYLDDQG
jgi:hypothetical protein